MFVWWTHTVEQAIKYFVDSGDFYLDLKNNIKYLSQVWLEDSFENRGISRTNLIKHCINKWLFNCLSIRYIWREWGSDSNEKHIAEYIKQGWRVYWA